MVGGVQFSTALLRFISPIQALLQCGWLEGVQVQGSVYSVALCELSHAMLSSDYASRLWINPLT